MFLSVRLCSVQCRKCKSRACESEVPARAMQRDDVVVVFKSEKTTLNSQSLFHRLHFNTTGLS